MLFKLKKEQDIDFLNKTEKTLTLNKYTILFETLLVAFEISEAAIFIVTENEADLCCSFYL